MFFVYKLRENSSLNIKRKMRIFTLTHVLPCSTSTSSLTICCCKAVCNTGEDVLKPSSHRRILLLSALTMKSGEKLLNCKINN